MKRSTMLQIICNHVNNNIKYYYKNGVEFEEHEASYLLSALENAGMVPPENGADCRAWENEDDGGEQLD